MEQTSFLDSNGEGEDCTTGQGQDSVMEQILLLKGGARLEGFHELISVRNAKNGCQEGKK